MTNIDLDALQALAEKATQGEWERSERPTGPFWHISSNHTVNGKPCLSGRQAIASVHAESKKGASAYAAMFEANAAFIAAANPQTILSLIARIRELEGDTGKSAEADTARLDFLDGNLKFKMGWSVRAAPVGNLSVSSIIMGGKPIREAVDAAISAGRAAPEGGKDHS